MGATRAVAFVLCLLAALLPPGSAPIVVAQVTRGATLSILTPVVEVSLQGASFGVAREGQTLAPGDQVRTGSGGVALLTFFDGSETQLTPNTQIQLDAASPASPTSVLQGIGTSASRVIPPPNNGFQIESAPAAAIVRGTTFVVTVHRVTGQDQSLPCAPTDLGACVTSAVLLADPDGRVGRVDLAAHANSSVANLTRACDLAGAFTTTALAQLDPATCAQLQQAVQNLRDATAALTTGQLGDQANQAIAGAAGAPGGGGGSPGGGGGGSPGGGGGSPGGGGGSPGGGGTASAIFAQATGPVGLGIDQGYRDPTAMADSGSNWQRLVIPWRAAQPDGPGDFSKLASVLPRNEIQAELDRGVKLTALVQFTPGWAQANPDQGERSPPKNLYLPFDDPQNYWGQFVYQLATFYAGTIDEWVIWNEPEFQPGDAGAGGSFTWLGTDKDFSELLKVAYLAIKKANPKATVSFPGTSYWVDQNANRRQYYDRLLDVIASDPDAARNNLYHDAVALNIYRTADDILRVNRVFQAIQRAHGISRPLWLNETNAMPTDDKAITPCDHSGDPIKTTLEQQAAFVVQAFAMAAVAGYQRIGFYQMVDDGPCNQPAVWGAVRDDGSRRPAIDALRTIIREIANFSQARFAPVSRAEVNWAVWPEDPASYWPNWSVYQMAFDLPDNRRVTVLWNATGTTACVRIPRRGSGGQVLDKRGATTAASQQGGEWVLNLPAASAQYADDPAGYFFIGGDPLLLVETGIDPGAGVSPPAICAP